MINKRIYFNIVSLSIFLGVLFYLFTYKSIYGFHKFCPNSFICFFYFFVKKNIIIFKIGAVFFLLLIIFSIFYRRRFCSYACPIGFIYDLIYIKRQKNFKFSSFNYKLNKISLISSVLVLLLIIFIPLLKTNKLFFDKLCPVILFSNILYGKYLLYTITVLVSLFLLSFFIPRFFCRFICPLGLFMGVVGYISHFFTKNKTISLDIGDSCINCYQCEKNCPMLIKVLDYKDDINTIQCIQCGECVVSCPLINRK